MALVKKLPVPICGLALGLAALGNLLVSYSEAVRYACGGVALLILLLFTLKVLVNFASFKKELENPVPFSVLPTYTMAWMLLAAYLRPFAATVGLVLWFAALGLQLCIMAAFVRAFVPGFTLGTVFPSWFIVFVGFVVASVTAPAMGMQPLGRVLFYVGFALYLCLLALVLYRFVKLRALPPPAQPTLAIVCAPAGLCLAGYLAAFEEKNAVLVHLLLALCGLSYLFVLGAMTRLLRLPFFPSYSSFTFPLVICAIGFKSCNGYFAASLGATWLGPVVPVATVLATAAVGYVLVRYVVFLLAAPKAQPEAAGQKLAG